MASTSTSGGANTGQSPDVQNAIDQYKQAEDESTAQSLQVSTAITTINGKDNAIKKISPG